MGTFAETAAKENNLPFSVSVFSKQTEGLQFQLSMYSKQTEIAVFSFTNVVL
jgi:hypothetical protein